jgi:hypothetical protein
MEGVFERGNALRASASIRNSIFIHSSKNFVVLRKSFGFQRETCEMYPGFILFDSATESYQY